MAAQIAGRRSIQIFFRNGCGDLAQQQKAGDRQPSRLHPGPFLHRRGFKLPDAPSHPQHTDPCENMSTDTQNSQNQGESRRRRSRGGQNRNRNKNSDQNRSNGRQSGGGKRTEGRQQGGSGRPKRRMPAPQLSWWQKLLKAVGLYKEPVRPPRPERRPSASEEKKPRRTKTRDARSDKSSDSGSEREPRGKSRSGGKNTNRPRGGDPSTVESRRVYVGNLSYDSTENDIEELFKGVGAVRTVEIVYNRNTHRSKGYGFVEMIDIDEAKRTVEVLHDQFFMGRKLTVSGAKSKDHQDAESEEGNDNSSNQSVPPLAPTNPKKEEVTDLINDSKKEEAKEEPSEPVAKVTTEEPNSEVPTEEFSPEEDTPQEVKDKAE